MSKSTIALLCFLWIVTLYVIGILLFTNGFLLKRREIVDKSACIVDFSTQSDAHAHGDAGCWMHRRFKRAVILVIDALRYDFVASNITSSANSMPFQNKLTVIHDLLNNAQSQNKARLYHFMADPPTTTMQRLKGLTTGSLPTFVDAGANFGQSEISEDNIIDQFIKNDKIIYFTGDDTWTGLFPERFYKTHSYPSLNVKDLHTVDNGVIKHLLPEMKKKTWDILIGHFLGVDHCGHTYGPNHPEMAKKLEQMNDVIRSVIKEMKSDTILFVMGDHGMTRTGDHGGDSQDELDAALFIYSPTQITSSPPQKGKYDVVSQVDFVPTISLLLGSPIPFSNLGAIITDLFNYCPWWDTDGNKIKQVYHVVKALRLNANQVHNYLKMYSQVSEEFPVQLYADLSDLFEKTEGDLQKLVTSLHLDGNNKGILPQLEELEKQYQNYLSRVKEMCQNIWAKFDLNLMFVGLCLTFLAVTMNLCFFINMHTADGISTFLFITIVFSVWLVVFFIFIWMLSLNLSGLILCTLSGTSIFLVLTFVLTKVMWSQNVSTRKENKIEQCQTLSILSFFSAFSFLIYMASLFSNSFVVYEDSVSAFMTQSLLSITLIQSIISLCGRSEKKDRLSAQKADLSSRSISTHLTLASLTGLAILCGAAIRLVDNFVPCREEQWTCEISRYLQSLSSITDDQQIYKNYKYFFTVASVLVLPLFLRFYSKYYGNLNGYSPSVICASYICPLSMVFACFYWALQAAPKRIVESMPDWQLIMSARAVCVLGFLSFPLLIFSPLSIFVVFPNKSKFNMPFQGTDDIMPRMYNHIKMNWKKHLPQFGADNEISDKPPLVYGLATVYSSAIFIMLFNVLPALLLLFGDATAPAITLQLVASILFLELVANQKSHLSPEEKLNVSWGLLCMWNFLATHFFFGSNHQATITSIRWESAYVGFVGDHTSYVIPSIMITLNTFGSLFISIFMSPLLLFRPFSSSWLYSIFKSKTPVNEQPDQKGEFFLKENGGMLRMAMIKLMLGCLLFYGCRVFATMLAAGILRRHLMVWKIFAPRYIFECAGFVFVSFLLVIVYLVVTRIDNVLEKWTNSLDK